MKKLNRAEAIGWQRWHRQQERDSSTLQEQKFLLYDAGEKRKTGYPCEDTIRRLGYPDVADKIKEAYRLLSDANRIMEQQK